MVKPNRKRFIAPPSTTHVGPAQVLDAASVHPIRVLVHGGRQEFTES
jgi:hypothetical protein